MRRLKLKTGWEGHAAGTGKIHKSLVKNLTGRDHFEDLDVVGSIILKIICLK
jgi:hypothetical protein